LIVDLARKIRRAVVQDHSLSMLAHNVKIISTSYTPALLYPPSSAERRPGRSWWHSRRRPYRGALVGMGIPEYEAKRYEGKVKDGNILMSVHTEDSKERERAKEILVKNGAEDISYTGEASVSKDQKTTERRY
jgi:hypothetical protein